MQPAAVSGSHVRSSLLLGGIQEELGGPCFIFFERLSMASVPVPIALNLWLVSI